MTSQNSTVFDAAWYDQAMTGEGEPAMLPLEVSPWRPIYQEAVRWTPSTAPVVDLGCGTGRFLACLAQSSHRATMLGVDFSPAAIEEARRYVKASFVDEMEFHHRARFQVADLAEWEPRQDGREPTTFVCLEVLEHIHDDLAVVEKIPQGHQLVFSVPSYMSESHVRCFGSLREVFDRYQPLLNIRRWTLVEFGDGKCVHVIDSVRRSGAW